jgi:CarD family transcriptional regulator
VSASSAKRPAKKAQSAKSAAAKPKVAAKKPAAAKAKDAPKVKEAPKAKRASKASAAAKASPARKPKAAAVAAPKPKKMPTKVNGFSVGDHVVYPAHGVGQITGIEEHAVGDLTLQMFVVSFDKEKMTLRVPTNKVDTAGMRRLSSQEKMDAAISTLQGRARTRRVMWSRRAQEYEAKLNSGDPVSIAEVVRDLHRNVGQPDQSYSERQMYEAALERLAREFAAVENTDTDAAAARLEEVLRAA